jgi:uncharacterized FlaG/YvyC family protein
MTRKNFINRYFAGIFSEFPEKERTEIMNKMKEISDGEADAEFITRIRNEYGDLAQMVRSRQIQVLLESINRKVQFFMILTIAGMVIAIICVLIMLK